MTMSDTESDSGSYFFEGAEKLLEVWFGSDEEQSNNNCDLRKIPRSALETITQMVKCQIISSKRNEWTDSYVLSESSMFVSKDRFLIKTCGTTSLLRCLEPLIYLAKEVAGFDEVVDMFYSRKNLLQPQMQLAPHQDMNQETELLDSFFTDGGAYCFGRMNQDHWFLYTLNPSCSFKGVTGADQTIEVLMHNLDEDKMKIFTKDVSIDGPDATRRAGIDKLIPGTVIDDFLFSPCGYSMNGLIKGGYYMTIHITPESGFSYVSFETNYPAVSYADLVAKVIKTFMPGTVIVTVMTNEASTCSLTHKELQGDGFNGYGLKDFTMSKVKNYDVTYSCFNKAPS